MGEVDTVSLSEAMEGDAEKVSEVGADKIDAVNAEIVNESNTNTTNTTETSFTTACSVEKVITHPNNDFPEGRKLAIHRRPL